MMIAGNLGLDYGALWQSAKQAGGELYKDLPGVVKQAVGKTVSQKVSQVATPVIQQIAKEKAQRVLSKGNVVLFAVTGATLGALVAGGNWKRRTLGGSIIGVVGALVGTKIGFIYESM
jgi:hypothetical protein